VHKWSKEVAVTHRLLPQESGTRTLIDERRSGARPRGRYCCLRQRESWPLDTGTEPPLDL
ncbi:MAG: hypothetical protein M1823_009067, partial [Watsoniomyces obsoletus]